MARIGALFLDLDSTLLDNSTFPQSIRQTCAELARIHPALDADELHRANGKAFKNHGLQRADDWTLGRISGAELGQLIWRQTLLVCDCDDENLAQQAAAIHGRCMRASYHLFADVAELVAAVDRTGTPVALITNGASDTQREKLDALGLADWFGALAISGEMGVAKPDPAAFAPPLAALGVSGGTVWHVGDNPATDVAGAQAAGLTAVWLNRSGAERSADEPQADVEITSLSELIPHL